MTYNPNIHNRMSHRLQGYDYSQCGAYFITICTYKKEHLFGEILDAEIKLNLIGQYAYQQWKQIPLRFENVDLGEFVIMPNHIHAIIVKNTRWDEGAENESADAKRWPYFDPSCLQEHQPTQPNGTISGSIGAIIQNYKSGTTRKIKSLPGKNNLKIWQANYYDHIIRDEKDYDRIKDYICNNPINWEKDELFSNGT